MTVDPIVIVGSARTPMGGFQGDFAEVEASKLGGAAISAALDIAARPEAKGQRIVVIIPSFGERYLSTALFEGLGE